MMNHLPHSADAVREKETPPSRASWIAVVSAGILAQLGSLTAAGQSKTDEPEVPPLSQEQVQELIEQMGGGYQERMKASAQLEKHLDWPTVLQILKAQFHSDAEIARRAQIIRQKNTPKLTEKYSAKYTLDDLGPDDDLPWLYYPEGYELPGKFKNVQGRGYSGANPYLQKALEAGAKASGRPDWHDWKWATKFALQDIHKEDFPDALATSDPDTYMNKKRAEYRTVLIPLQYKAEDRYREQHGHPKRAVGPEVRRKNPEGPAWDIAGTINVVDPFLGGKRLKKTS